MKNNYIFIIIVFIFSYASGQTRLDSLYGIWEDNNQPDSSRVDAFYEYAMDGYLYSQPDSALVLANRLIEFSKLKDYKNGMALAFRLQGNSYTKKGDYPKALEIMYKSLKIYEEIKDKEGIAVLLNNIGNVYREQGNYIKALGYYQRVLEIREETKDKERIAGVLIRIGIIYSYQGNQIKTLDYYQRSLEIYEEIKDKEGIAMILNNIGLIYYDMNDYPNALNYYQRSLELGMGLEGAHTLTNIGNVYRKQGNYIKALDYLQRNLVLMEKNEDKYGIANSLSYIGEVYNAQGDYPRALDYYQRSLEINEEINNKYGITMLLKNIGTANIGEGDYIKAVENCGKALVIYENLGDVLDQKAACECLYNAYKAQKKSDKALVYHEQMLVLQDSLQTEETVKKLQQMEFAKQIFTDSLAQVEKDLKMEMAHQSEVQQENRSKKLAIGAGLFFLLVAGGYYSRWRYIKKSKAVIEKEKDRSENLLLNILPAEIAEELKLNGSAEARDFEMASVLFTDFSGFTSKSAKLSAKELLFELNDCFKAFDDICEKFGIEKIKTIGDSFMAVGGLPIPNEESTKNTILAALEMQSFISKRMVQKQAKKETFFEMRLGIHTGTVVAGIVGVKKFQYDIWGDTVNTASRMQSNGEVGKVNISQHTYELVKNDSNFAFEERGKIQVKGKGELEMYFVKLSEVA